MSAHMGSSVWIYEFFFFRSGSRKRNAEVQLTNTWGQLTGHRSRQARISFHVSQRRVVSRLMILLQHSSTITVRHKKNSLFTVERMSCSRLISLTHNRVIYKSWKIRQNHEMCISFHTDLLCQFQSDLRRDLSLSLKKKNNRINTCKLCTDQALCQNHSMSRNRMKK